MHGASYYMSQQGADEEVATMIKVETVSGRVMVTGKTTQHIVCCYDDGLCINAAGQQVRFAAATASCIRRIKAAIVASNDHNVAAFRRGPVMPRDAKISVEMASLINEGGEGYGSP